MKTTMKQRLGLTVLAIILLGYAGYQLYRYVHGQYKTETAYAYTVAETSRVAGIVLRREMLLDDYISGGVAAYTAADGTKVSIAYPIAEIYQDEKAAENIRKLRELENRKALLEKAQDPGTTSFAHTDVLNKQISSELGNIIGAVDSNSLCSLKTNSDKLLVLMNTKQIATGKQDDFSDALEAIDAQMRYYNEQLSQGAPTRTITAPRQGYFIRNIDGYENCVEWGKLGELTSQQVFDLVNREAPKSSVKRVGKLMTDHNWYYAVVVPEEEISRYRKGAQVTLDFNLSGLDPVPAEIAYVNPPENPKEQTDYVVVFRSDYISEQLVNLRVTQAEVKFKSVTGLRVSNSALRFQGVQQGVYIVLGDKLVFRPVTIVYEDMGFVLCREYDEAYQVGMSYTGLQQFDQVVIEGVQLYDDKRIK